MSDYIDLKNFISKRKSLLIAPAGCGKTYTIAECLKYTEGVHLILTHTHAGVASLKEKIKEKGIKTNKYRVETIDSYAQKYVNAFYCRNDVPEQDSKDYFPFIIEKAFELVKIKPISDVIKLTYAGLFVDEYQDCAKNQHKFIMALSEILPTHVLGDPLQGIFSFREQKLVDFDEDLKGFEKFDLKEPWRWKNTNPELGICLMKIRKKLENKEDIDLNTFKDAIEVVHINEEDISKPHTNYNKKIWDLLNESNLLIIHPESRSINTRIKIIKNFENRIYLVEAIDDKDFYKFSKNFDKSTPDNIYKIIYDFISTKAIFKKTGIENWFTKKSLKNKKLEKDREKIEPIRRNLEKLQNKISFLLIAQTLKQIKNLPGVLCYRKELFNDLCKALEEAEYNNTSVYESMKKIKNRKRKIGRKIEGKCIGTTLLVKGLEFDTVAVLNVHEFEDPKNLYVALTRASHKLIVFTNSSILSPYSKQRNVK